MPVPYPFEGFNGFALVYGQQVVYSTVSDASTHMPRRHPESLMWIPFGFVIPFEMSQNNLMQSLHGNHSSPDLYTLAPLITVEGELYTLETKIQDGSKTVRASLTLPKDDDTPTPLIYTTDTAVRNVIATCLHLTGSIEAMLDHIAKFHGCRRHYVVQTTVGAIANECYRRKLNEHIEGIYYGCLADSNLPQG